MPPTDVIKHDLTALRTASVTNLDEYLEPIPFPRTEGSHLMNATAGLTPPLTSLVTPEELVTAPYRSVGKMGLILADAKKKGGSGWVVARKAFITAGHCVYHSESGGWISQAVFVPRYDNVVVTSYTVEAVYALRGWVESDDRAYDMAACVVTENFAVTEPPLAFDTGILPGLKFTAIGYPIRPTATNPFNGKRMWKCTGEMVSFTDNLIWAVNDLTAGSSGGPWCEPDNNMVVSGLTAARDDDPMVAASAYFPNGFQNLYDAVKNL